MHCVLVGGQTVESVVVKYLIKLPQSKVWFCSDVAVLSLENMVPGALQGSALGMVPYMPSANRSTENDNTHTTGTGHAQGTRNMPRVVSPVLPTQLPVPSNWREANDQILAVFIKAALISQPESTDITFKLVSFNSMSMGLLFLFISQIWLHTCCH